MKDRLLLAEQIVSSRFKKDNIYYGMYVLSCYGLLTKYEDYSDIIKKLFETCEFYITNKQLKELNYDIYEFDVNDDNGEILGFSDIGKDCYIDNDELIIYNYTNPKFFCSTKNGPNETINTVIHELSHLIKSSIKTFYKENNSIIQRCGLYKIEETEENYIFSFNSSLDEVINVLQVSDILKEIKKLSIDNLNEETKKFFNKLDLEDLEKLIGYETGVMLIEPLWKNNSFKNLIEDNIVIGNIDKIEDEFNKTIGINNGFSYFSSSFDMIMDSENSEDEILEHVMHIESIVNLYNLKTNDCKVYQKQ